MYRELYNKMVASENTTSTINSSDLKTFIRMTVQALSESEYTGKEIYMAMLELYMEDREFFLETLEAYFTENVGYWEE